MNNYNLAGPYSPGRLKQEPIVLRVEYERELDIPFFSKPQIKTRPFCARRIVDKKKTSESTGILLASQIRI